MLRSLFLMVFAGVLSIAQAQELAQPNPEANKSPEKVAQMRTDRMATGLELTATQKTKVYNINLKYAQKRQEMMKSQFSTPEEQRMEKRKMGENYQNELKAVLNNEQYQKFVQHRMDKKNGKTGATR